MEINLNKVDIENCIVKILYTGIYHSQITVPVKYSASPVKYDAGPTCSEVLSTSSHCYHIGMPN
jgi:hypothetical protein